MQVDWFVSVRDEETGVPPLPRGGAGFDRASVIEQVIRAGRDIACREDGAVVGVVGEVVIDGTAVGAIAFGDRAVSDEGALPRDRYAVRQGSVLFRLSTGR